MPLHRTQGNKLTSTAEIRVLLRMRDTCVKSYCSWRKVADNVGAFAVRR